MERSLLTAIYLLADYQGWAEGSDERNGAIRAHQDYLSNVAACKVTTQYEILLDLADFYSDSIHSAIDTPECDRIRSPGFYAAGLKAIRLLQILVVR